jgi:hypothetical protein
MIREIRLPIENGKEGGQDVCVIKLIVNVERNQAIGMIIIRYAILLFVSLSVFFSTLNHHPLRVITDL